MNGSDFIISTDGRQYYMESLLHCIVFSYNRLVDDKKIFDRKLIHEQIKLISKSNDAYNELEDYLSTTLVKEYIKPSLKIFGLESLVVNIGVRETKSNVTLGHLDIKFEVPGLADNHYYAFEAKRLNRTKQRQDYYIKGGIERFTSRKYYPETNINVAGMIGFVENKSNKKGCRPTLNLLKDSLNTKIQSYSKINTSDPLRDYILVCPDHPEIETFKFAYLSKHTRDEDQEELLIYHILLDYYELLI